MAINAKLASKRQARSQRRTENAKHPWRVGELCLAVYDNLGEGLIYRVTAVSPVGTRVSPLLKVKPIFGVVSEVGGRMPRTLDATYCTPMSLVDLATLYAKFGLFIAEEAKQRGKSDEETTTEEILSGDNDPNEERPEASDGGGLLVCGTSVQSEGTTDSSGDVGSARVD